MTVPLTNGPVQASTSIDRWLSFASITLPSLVQQTSFHLAGNQIHVSFLGLTAQHVAVGLGWGRGRLLAFPCELSAPYSHLPNALGCMVVHVAHLGRCAVFSSQPLANCFIFSESAGKCSRLLVKGPWIRLSKLSPQFAHALCKYSRNVVRAGRRLAGRTAWTLWLLLMFQAHELWIFKGALSMGVQG